MATEKEREARKGIDITNLAGIDYRFPNKPPAKPGEDHMAEANGLVNGDRQAAYGPPGPSYEAMAKVWSGMLAHKLSSDLTAADVVLLLAAMKLRREANKHKRDNIVDTHGYMLVLAHVHASEDSKP